LEKDALVGGLDKTFFFPEEIMLISSAYALLIATPLPPPSWWCHDILQQ
jgi:hypothetical protein